jgi:hypothetical protein
LLSDKQAHIFRDFRSLELSQVRIASRFGPLTDGLGSRGGTKLAFLAWQAWQDRARLDAAAPASAGYRAQRFSAMALFGRRPVERAGVSLLPASKNQHKTGNALIEQKISA